MLRIPLGWIDDPVPAIAAKSIDSAITARKSLLTKPSISVLPVDPSNDWICYMHQKNCYELSLRYLFSASHFI